MYILELYCYSGYLLLLAGSLVLLYFCLIQFLCCIVGPSLLKLLFSDIIKDFSVSKVTLLYIALPSLFFTSTCDL